MSKKMTVPFRIKFFLDKRLTPYAERMWDIRSVINGYRKKKHAEKYGEPIDMQGKQHLHIYPTIKCHFDCHFCQNKFYTDYSVPQYPNPDFKMSSAKEWCSWLNRMYNFHHIDFNGGEPFNYPHIIEMLNTLENHNIVIFTNIPAHIIPRLKEINTKKNNIQMICSYHHLEEDRKGRSLYQYAHDFKQIPRGLKPTCQVIDVPEVSGQDNASGLIRWGIHVKVNNAHTPTEHNKLKDKNFKTAMCHSDMDCIAPDLTVYRCLGLMMRKIDPIHISDYKFTNNAEWCDYYGLCGPCSMQKDVYDIK